MTRARDVAGIIGSSRLTIDTNNNIGIGSTTPDAKFDVNGSFTVAGITTFGTTNIVRIDNDGNINAVGIVTALRFRGDGSQLSGVSGGADITAVLFV